jgi:uncharacterized caspase-like protein
MIASGGGRMAALLRGVGFDVMEATDLTLSQMREPDNPYATKERKSSRDQGGEPRFNARGRSSKPRLRGKAAEDGPKAGHSPFTKALLVHIAAPGIEIQRVTVELRADVSEETERR